jgi:DNA-binding transcriptional LysR family regulator
MRIEQLEAFLAIYETGNFGQAAQECGVTQSTISRQVQALETYLGIALFHRHAKAKLTVGGELILPHIRKMAQEWKTIQEKTQELIQGKQPELCVATIHSVCAYYLPPILLKFCQIHPQVQLRVTSLGSDRALKVLRDGLVDIALVMDNRYLTTTPEMVVAPLYEEPILILMSANHPLSQYAAVSLTQLAPYAQVIFKDGYGMQRIVQQYFVTHGFDLQVAMELNTLDGFRGVIRQGNLVALLPQSALREAMQDPTLAIRKLQHNSSELIRKVVLVTTRDRLKIPTIADFFNLVLESLGESLPQLSPEYSLF